MGVTDPIADMLTRIRNANMARFDYVDIPCSKTKADIARILMDEGYVKGFEVIKDRKQGILRIFLKYRASKRGIIRGIIRVSKPSRRVYVNKDKVPHILSGLGISILSTSRGIMSDKRARENGVGGEILCSVW